MKKIFMILILLLFQFYILAVPALSFSPSTNIIYEGIDVSAWQGDINFVEVKAAGIDIVYIKSSEGFSFVDPYFEQNYTNAKKAGLNVGFYHYVTARSVQEAKNQASFFVSTISGKNPDCKLAIDFESFGNLSNYLINEIALAFIQSVQSLSGKEVIIYSDSYNASNVFDSRLSNYPLWVAQYEVYEPFVNKNWSTWAGWQYTDKGEVSGVTGYVDRDKFTETVFLNDKSEIPDISDGSSDGSSDGLNYITITIQYGDTLSGLAIKYNTTVSELVKLNNISNPDLIYAGHSLIVPDSNSPTACSTTYVIQPGDTLSQIALDYGSTVSEIAYTNNIRNINLIFPGQVLHIPTSHCDMSHTLYIVKRGDTLWGISRRFGVSIARIVMLNRISNPNLIYPGNVLKI